MKPNTFIRLGLLSAIFACPALKSVGQDKSVAQNPSPAGAPGVQASRQALFEKFQRLLTGAKLVGQFTVDGQPLSKLAAEEYEISKVEKLPEGDQWAITSRIKYGAKDYTVPVPLDVKWAGNTPVLTLDNLTLPGFGTFSARVVLHVDKYAGTWQHGDKGGHMFGKIELAKPSPTKEN